MSAAGATVEVDQAADDDGQPGDRAHDGAMGDSVLVPADGRPGFTLSCAGCGREEHFPARFMGERVLQLGRARREGWGFREGELVEHRLDGRVLQRVARLCPVCAVVERHAREGGLWGHLLAALVAERAGLAAAPAVLETPPAVHQVPPPAIVRPSGQLDMFGHVA